MPDGIDMFVLREELTLDPAAGSEAQTVYVGALPQQCP